MKSRFIGGLSGEPHIEEEYDILDEIERDIDFYEDEVEIIAEDNIRWLNKEEKMFEALIATEPI